MIYINGFGWRLGNQLFQIAAAIGLAKKYNDEVAYPWWPYAKYFQGSFPNDSSIDIRSGVYTEPHFHYADIPYTKDMAIDGYWQSERYFEHCKRFVKKAFTPIPISTGIDITDNACFIHVRRGDYVRLQEHHPLQTWENYYSKAVTRMEYYYPSKYYVFSDDIEDVKKDFPEHPLFEYINTGDEMSDFYLMTKCKHHIIGNSSYSWWSAYLSEHENGITIAPHNWFGPRYYYHNLKDLYPQGWLTI